VTAVADRIPAEHQLRITTLNINHDPAELERRTGLVCDELGILRPEVLCLQEVTFEADGTSRQLKMIAAETGLAVVAASTQSTSKHGHLSGNAVLSSLVRIEAGTIVLGTPGEVLKRVDYAVLQSRTGQTLIVVSAHLCWGGDKEGVRLAQTTAIDGRIRALMDRYKDRHPVAILAGDFNSLPDSDTHRYLAGLGAGANGGYTFWTEAFAVAGNPEEATTVAADNYWAQKTARGVGIEFPELLPDRRIDFVYTYGWAYGRPGCPVAVQRSFTDTTRYGFPASDHYGLTADFWTPPVPGADVRTAAGHETVAPTGQLAIITPAHEPVLV
jgi:endonuclease/exonuclease/phosphatase family metal-dependent hydrolase